MSNYLFLYSQALERFYEAVMQAILRHINFDGSAAVTHVHTYTMFLFCVRRFSVF